MIKMPPARGSWNAAATASISSERPSSGHDVTRAPSPGGEKALRTGGAVGAVGTEAAGGAAGSVRRRGLRIVELGDRRDEPVAAAVDRAHDLLALAVVTHRTGARS